MYLQVDVLEKIRNSSLKNQGLCPSNYLSAPTVSWDTILNMTKVQLELISDADMCLLLEKSMKVSYISNR